MPSGVDARLSERALALCRIASPIGEERAIADHVERWAQGRFGASQVVRRSHSLVLGSLSDPRPTLALVGHLDTVPPHPTDAPARVEGDRLIALGSSDMKGGVAVMLELADRLPLADLAFNLLLILYEREEGPFLESGLGPLLQEFPALGRIELGIALEPTDNVVQVGCVGSIHAGLHFSGKSAHSARPWQGDNAIHRAGPLLAELLALPRREVRFDGYVFYEVLSATTAKAGRARNVVPDSFDLNLNYRFAPGKSLEEAQEDVRQFVNGRAEIQFTDLAPSGRVCADNRHFRRLLDLTGLAAESKQAWTDVARLSAHGIDAINFGPGETAQAHQARESASLSALTLAFEKLQAFLTAPIKA